ncbi:MAG: GNAT family N-acetyltransferase [Acidimicrobiales bacterium]
MEGVRRAGRDDLPRLAELAEAAIAELTSTKGGAVWSRREARPSPVDDSLAAALAADDHLVVAGTVDDVVIGYAVVRIEMLRNGERLAVVDDIYVEPGARGVGVGEAMMDAVVEWCRGHDCIGVDSLALPGNRETKNFFESFGLVARAIVVHRSLRPPHEPAGADPGS